jgi:hypothetical protein
LEEYFLTFLPKIKKNDNSIWQTAGDALRELKSYVSIFMVPVLNIKIIPKTCARCRRMHKIANLIDA